MRISSIKQGYIVKPVLFLSFLFVISLGLIGGCSDSGGGNDTQALTENDFAEDSSLRADLEGVVVTFLEAPNSEESENDTGEVGIDLIPIRYPRTTEQTFCWEDDDVDAMHFMELRDSQETLILTVEANGDCVTEVIEVGDYVMSVHHDGSVEDSLPIFLIPDPEELEEARETDGLIDRFKLSASNILKQIERTITKDAQAQSALESILANQFCTLISTNKCPRCVLVDVNLSRRNLTGADLSGADLSIARLRNTNLTQADLSGADLLGAILTNSILTQADLSGADLSGADLSGATWCDGTCVCAQGSLFGTCIGCSPVEEVCTGP